MENANDNRYSRLLYAGSSLIVVTIAAGAIVYLVYPHIFELVALIASLTGSVGIALIIIVLIESRHLATALKETSSQIITRSSSILDTKFKDTFDILEHARYTGLTDILPPRQDEARASETHIVIADDIKRSSKLLGGKIFACPRFSFSYLMNGCHEITFCHRGHRGHRGFFNFIVSG